MAVNQTPEPGAAPDQESGSLVILALVSLLAGAASGLVGAAFRLILQQADRYRELYIGWAHDHHFLGFFVVICVTAGATAIAASLVHRISPQASGSGIPHVEAVLNGEQPPASFTLLPVKFLGGLLAIGAGLALGREGPTVQMGASISHLLGKLCRRPFAHRRVLMAAGAGAGLATAFNAPIAGAVFVLEELVRRFETHIAIAALGASAGAIAVAVIFLGHGPDFLVPPLPYPGFDTVIIHIALGASPGSWGWLTTVCSWGPWPPRSSLRHWPAELKAGLIGALVGVVAWFGPSLVGGGDAITQSTLTGPHIFSGVLVVFLIRFGLGPLSYAAGTPGGLFAPMLVLGAQIGLLFGVLTGHVLPAGAVNPTALAVVGMAAFFTAVVRAPVTGIILVIEMTASFSLFLPMLAACFTAMLVPTLLGNPPIYDSLGAPYRRPIKPLP